MTRTEVKKKINEIIDRLPDRSLETIYKIFKKAEENKELNLESSINKVIKEDSDLLQRLAE